MDKVALLVIVASLCTACAHSELKAPCSDRRLGFDGIVPCDQPQPINPAFSSSWMSQ